MKTREDIRIEIEGRWADYRGYDIDFLIDKIADLQYQINELRGGLTVSSAANSAEGISYKE